MGAELILIVEDNDQNMRLVRDLLEYHGYRTLGADTAIDALEMVAVELPDLILMDIQLPDMDGLAVLSRLQSDPSTADVTVVALTSFAMAGDRDRFLAAGFHGYLAKPIDVKSFPEQIRKFCDRRRP